MKILFYVSFSKLHKTALFILITTNCIENYLFEKSKVKTDNGKLHTLVVTWWDFKAISRNSIRIVSTIFTKQLNDCVVTCNCKWETILNNIFYTYTHTKQVPQQIQQGYRSNVSVYNKKTYIRFGFVGQLNDNRKQFIDLINDRN